MTENTEKITDDQLFGWTRGESYYACLKRGASVVEVARAFDIHPSAVWQLAEGHAQTAGKRWPIRYRPLGGQGHDREGVVGLIVRRWLALARLVEHEGQAWERGEIRKDPSIELIRLEQLNSILDEALNLAVGG